MKDIIFIASHFSMSENEAKEWISKHTKEEIDTIFNLYLEVL